MNHHRRRNDPLNIISTISWWIVLGTLAGFLLYMVVDTRIQNNQAEAWVDQQTLIAYTIQPGDSWSSIFKGAPEYIGTGSLASALMDVSQNRGYVAWTGWFHHTLITGASMMVPESFAKRKTTVTQ